MKQLLNVVFTLTSCSLVVSGEVITFETLSDQHFFGDAGTSVESFYPGINIGPGVTGLSVSRFGGYSSAAFPPHSGDVVLWSPFDFDTTITFSTLQTSVGIWYTSLDFLTLSAFDASNNLLGSVTGDPNTDGTTGASTFLSLSASGIASLVLSGSPGFFVFDDLTFTAEPDTGGEVPEPKTILLVVAGLALLGVLRFRRSERPS